MKFIIYKTSDSFRPAEMPVEGCNKEYAENGDWYYTKEINSIEELMEICNIDGEIVVSVKDFLYGKPKIEIYNTYRE